MTGLAGLAVLLRNGVLTFVDPPLPLCIAKYAPGELASAVVMRCAYRRLAYVT